MSFVINTQDDDMEGFSPMSDWHTELGIINEGLLPKPMDLQDPFGRGYLAIGGFLTARGERIFNALNREAKRMRDGGHDFGEVLNKIVDSLLGEVHEN